MAETRPSRLLTAPRFDEPRFHAPLCARARGRWEALWAVDHHAGYELLRLARAAKLAANRSGCWCVRSTALREVF